MKTKKEIYGWGLIVRGSIFMTGQEGYRKWARILRTRKQAKEEYPTQEIVKVKITPLPPKKK